MRALTAVRRRAERLGGADDAAATRLVARTLMSQSAPHFEITGDLEAALDLLTRADRLAEAAHDPSLRATVRAQRALVVLRSGDTRAALRAFDEAVAQMERVSARDRAILLLNRGALHLEHTDLARAEADLVGSAGFAEQIGDARLSSMARHNLGYVEFLAGRLPRALALLEEAESRLAPAEPHPNALLDRARVLREAGLVRDAQALLEKASAIFQASRLQQEVAETDLARAECALVEGDGTSGYRLAASAYRRFARRGNVRWQRKAELMMLRCQRLVAEGRPARQRATAVSALAARASELATACRRENRPDLARGARLLAEECRLQLPAESSPGGEGGAAPPRLRATDPLQTRLQVREVRALAALRQGSPPRAAAEVRRGLTELGAYQHSFGSLDLRTASAVHGAALARLGLDVAVASGSPAGVLNLVEHARAVSTRLPSVRPPGDEHTAALLSELRRVEEEARSLEGSSVGEEPRARLRERAAELQGLIRARSWEVEGERGDAGSAPCCTLVRDTARAAGTAFATFARHRGHWLAVSIRGRRVALHECASVAEVSHLVRRVRADLDALAAPGLPGPIAEAVRRSLALGLGRLDALLLEPLGLSAEPLVLSGSGDLVVVPWGLLPSRLGTPTVLTPSAASWLAGAATRRPPQPRVSAIAGPGLRCAAAEVAAVGRTWEGSTVHVGPEATTARAHEALAGADLVHVAAHGRHRHDNPLFSSVRLVDGSLYAYEVDPERGIAGCVVLSACEAGLATHRPGDETLGLGSVLLHLGATSIVAGVARISDDISAEIMERVHGSVATGTDVASALAMAQREAMEAGPAPFISLGATW